MEENSLEQGFASENVNGQLTSDALAYLDSASKWAKFLGILAYIGAGFCVLGGILFSTLMSSAMGSMMAGRSGFGNFGLFFGLIYLAMALPIFFLGKHLVSFSNNAQRTLRSNSSSDVTAVFKNLMSYFKLRGWLIIAAFGVYILMIIFMGAFMGAMASSRNL